MKFMDEFRRIVNRQAAANHPGTLVLVIDSTGGNCTDVMQEFVQMIRTCKMHTVAKIYSATSVAAILALACKEREIVEGGTFALHDGSVEVSASHFYNDQIIPLVRRLVMQMKELNRDLLRANKIHLPTSLLMKLDVSNRVQFSPAECLDFGIVSRIV